jgi:branched-chain amino acid transport system permease protein
LNETQDWPTADSTAEGGDRGATGRSERLRGRLPALRPPARAVLVVLLIAAVVFPALDPPSYLLRIVATIGIYSLLATGLNIVVGRAGLLDLGYVAFFGLGAYTYALVASGHFGIHAPFLVGLILAAAIAGTAGVLLGIPVLRLRGDYLAIVTLGFGEIVYLVLLNLDRPVNITGGVAGILDVDPADLFLFKATTLTQNYYLILAFVVFGVFVAHRLVASRIGRTWVAVREDEDAAQAVGINTTNAKLWAFAIGASFSGFGGSAFAALQGAVFPNSFLFTQSIQVLAMVVIGGMGTLWGPLVGAAVMIVMPELLRDFGALRFVLVGILFVVLMIFRPHGILGARRPERSLRRTVPPRAGPASAGGASSTPKPAGADAP